MRFLIIFLLLCGVAWGEDKVLKGGHICNTPKHRAELLAKDEWVDELTDKEYQELSDRTSGRWVRCPICGCDFSGKADIKRHKEAHIKKDYILDTSNYITELKATVDYEQADCDLDGFNYWGFHIGDRTKGFSITARLFW